jgi:hypothetical protein
LRIQGFQDGLGGAHGVGVRRGMPALEISEAVHLRSRINRSGDNTFEAAADLGFESFDKSVPGFANGDYENARIGVEVVEIIADAQDSALAVDVTGEGFGDAGFGESALEDRAGGVAQQEPGVRCGHARVRVSGMIGAWSAAMELADHPEP